MGKKVRDPASKSQKKQLNRLIKLLKPKVYITESSNFKNLVQQLTGNNGSSYTPPPPPPEHQYQEYSQELSIDSSEGSIPSSININTTFEEQCLNNSMASQEMEEYYCRNIEAWLLEIDSYTTTTTTSSYEGFVPMNIHEEVSVDDYGYDLYSIL